MPLSWTARLPRRSSGRRRKSKERSNSSSGRISPFSFGQWAEAGRLAALAQNPELFQDRKYQKFLRWQLRHAEELDPEVQGALQQIQAILERESLQANDFSRLKTHFEAILDFYFLPQFES